KNVTIKHLLTMTSGFTWDESHDESAIQKIEEQSDWVEAILKLPRKEEMFGKFNYSTPNVHLLSAVLTAATGQIGCQFIHEHILARIGAVAEHWGRDKQGYFSGGYNLYLTARELAKFGMLYLNGGKWNDEPKPVVPTAWVEASLAPQVVNADRPYDYGYLFWLRKLGGVDVAMAWGYGGQMIYIIKALNMVVVMTTNTGPGFEQDEFSGVEIMEQYVIPAAK